MNPVLKRILETRVVSDGERSYKLHSNIQSEEGDLIQRMIAEARPSTSLEVGMAYGVSTLFICDALVKLPHRTRHVAIDPNQSTQWRGVGLKHVREAGYEETVELIEQGSELALPRLLADGLVIEFAFIDGWHTFDHTLVDFFYVNRMLQVGGVVIFDDVSYESVHKLIRYLLNYPAYRLAGSAGAPSRPPSVAGRVRRGLAKTWLARRVLRDELISRPWDTGWGSSVALRKVGPDERPFDWYVDF